MRVNGREAAGAGGASLDELAAAYCPDADLALVDGVSVACADWARTVPADAAEVTLARKGVLPDKETYLTLLTARNQPGTVEKLSSRRVGVAGCGGLGSHAALALARMGVGALTLVDFDVVEPTNLNRQAYFAEDVGTLKATALARHIQKINPVVRLDPVDRKLDRENSADVFRGCDAILECLDLAEAKSMFVEAILAGLPGVPLVAASGLGGLGDPNLIATKNVFGAFWLVGDGESGVGPDRGLAAPRVMVAAGHQALCAARVLLDLV